MSCKRSISHRYGLTEPVRTLETSTAGAQTFAQTIAQTGVFKTLYCKEYCKAFVKYYKKHTFFLCGRSTASPETCTKNRYFDQYKPALFFS